MNRFEVLLLPGWQNSSALHWQSLWQQQFGYHRVEQHDWLRPLRGDWSARLEDVVLAAERPLVLVAHSLGCLLVAAWAAHSQHTQRVKAALLVAPGDAERDDLRPLLASWSPIVLARLPFVSTLVASRNDPYCGFARACDFAGAWGSELVDAGRLGHINAESGLGDWETGQGFLQALINPEPVAEKFPRCGDRSFMSVAAGPSQHAS